MDGESGLTLEEYSGHDARTAPNPMAAADGVVHEVIEQIGCYPAAGTVLPGELRASVEHSLQLAVAAIDDRLGRGIDLEDARRTAARCAREGAPLPEVLKVYRAAFVALWRAILDRERSRSVQTCEKLLAAATTILQFADRHADAMTEAYREAGAGVRISPQRRRSALLEALLTGHPTPEAGPWEAAALLGFPRGAHHVVVVADTPRVAEESLPDVEEKLAAAGIVSAWRLTPAQQLGLVALRDDAVDTVVRVVTSTTGARAGISPLFDNLSETPRALLLAQAALQTIPAREPGVHVFSSSPLAALVVCAPGEGLRLASRVLGPVLALPAEDRAMLIETLWVYLSNLGSAENAAQLLYCHANTVRYRLRRLQDLTGRHLSDPCDAAELMAAVYALRLNNSDPNTDIALSRRVETL
ncbi:hypothetical protein ABIA39_002057 [Nocardia sp. GAS34]|uniref:PucR family transcriptional regulator n=1 Tax=unclassified Nocardia TaxID=2637762 RepID=UPI003D226166